MTIIPVALATVTTFAANMNILHVDEHGHLTESNINQLFGITMGHILLLCGKSLLLYRSTRYAVIPSPHHLVLPCPTYLSGSI